MEIQDCFRLSVRGGPEKEYMRGLTLQLSTSNLDYIFNKLLDIDGLINSQKELTTRAEKIYGTNSVGLAHEKAQLQLLMDLKVESVNLEPKELAHKILDIIWK